MGQPRTAAILDERSELEARRDILDSERSSGDGRAVGESPGDARR